MFYVGRVDNASQHVLQRDSMMPVYKGKGFMLRDGTHRCDAFKVYAPDVDVAAYALNSAAGWMLVKPGEEGGILGSGSPVKHEVETPEVHLKWPGRRGYEQVVDLKRDLGGLRQAPERPATSSERAVKSQNRLRDQGGHRINMLLSPAAWQGLQALATEFELNLTETIEKLILERRKRLKG